MVDILDAERADAHALNPSARVAPGGSVTYPGDVEEKEQGSLFEE